MHATDGAMAPLDPGLHTWWDVGTLISFLVVALLYSYAVARRWRRVGIDRGPTVAQVGVTALGWLALVVALSSPIDRLSDLLFAAHMTQHELLMLVAAPLLVLGRPLTIAVWLVPAHLRPHLRTLQTHAPGRVWRVLTGPIVALCVHALVVWGWHLPVAFEAALRSEPLHAVQHAMFFGSAALFWWALLHGRYGRLGYGVSVAFVFVTAMHQGLLGALLTFAPTVWYPTYGVRAHSVGSSALEDQQLAGLLMWVPSGVLLLLSALALCMAWLGAIERRARLHDIRRRP